MVMLPTQITGAPGSTGTAWAILRAVTAAQIQEIGFSRIRVMGMAARSRSRTYHQRGVDSFTGPPAAAAGA